MVSFYKYFQREITNIKELFNTKIKGIDREKAAALLAMEKRLEGMNEFRDQLRDQASRFITRDEMTSKFDALTKEVDELRLSKATLEGKANQSSVNLSLLIAVLGLILAAAGIFMKYKN